MGERGKERELKMRKIERDDAGVPHSIDILTINNSRLTTKCLICVE